MVTRPLHPTLSAPQARIVRAALRAADPAAGVRHALARASGMLRRAKRIRLIGAGKAVAPMALAVLQALAGRVEAGVLIAKDGGGLRPGERLPSGVDLYEAAHPVPDQRGTRATQILLRSVSDLGPDDLVIVLLSGGGSALLTAPLVPLSDLQALTGLLLSAGADIEALNTLRKHLDAVKGGGLARVIAPARALVLALSDVIGDPPGTIASGPCAPDPTTFADALRELESRGLIRQAPASVREHLRRGLAGKYEDTPKPGDAIFERVQTVITGNNRHAARAALDQAREEGYAARLLTGELAGEARQAGVWLAERARQSRKRPACLIAGGETTVRVTGPGIGGRNQEAALAAVRALADVPGASLVTLATDGEDGPSGGAGALVTTDTLGRALTLDLDPDDALARNDSARFFAELGQQIVTGPTRTNVNDLAFVFLE